MQRERLSTQNHLIEDSKIMNLAVPRVAQETPQQHDMQMKTRSKLDPLPFQSRPTQLTYDGLIRRNQNDPFRKQILSSFVTENCMLQSLGAKMN